jgi:hypothetical protein
VPLHADRRDGRTYTAADRRRSGKTSTNGGLNNGHLKLHSDLHQLDGRDRERSAVVLSAYRSLQTNALLERTQFGVADNSQQLFGRALDISFPEAKLADAVAAARGIKRGGVGWYPRSKFIHLDTGPVRNWDLDAEGLQALLKGPHPGLPDPKTVGVKPTPKLPQVTVGGVKETLVSPGPTMPAVHGRVAGLLSPIPK